MNEEQEEEIKLELNLSEIIEQLHGIRRSENWIRRCAFLLQSCEKMLSALPKSAFNGGNNEEEKEELTFLL